MALNVICFNTKKKFSCKSWDVFYIRSYTLLNYDVYPLNYMPKTKNHRMPGFISVNQLWRSFLPPRIDFLLRNSFRGIVMCHTFILTCCNKHICIKQFHDNIFVFDLKHTIKISLLAFKTCYSRGFLWFLYYKSCISIDKTYYN